MHTEAMRSLPELPDHIIGQILSLVSLTNREAIQISLFSKELFWAVKNRPALIFDGRSQEELEYVHSALVRYHKNHIPLDTFKFQMRHHMKNDLQDQCISLAAKKRLRDLDLRGFKNFPEPFLEVESLVDLSLKDSSFWPRKSVVWPNLKRLCLARVTMELENFGNIIMSCPLIENLEVIRCFHWKLEFFEVFNLGNLKHLNVVSTSSITCDEEDAPELESITYRNLRTLSLSCVGVSEDFFINFGHRFPRLEDLSISNDSVLKNLGISSSSLKNIRLQNISGLKQARFYVPNIVLFEYYSTSSPILPELYFSGNPSGWISHVKLNYLYNSIQTWWFMRLNEFLRALNRSEISITVTFHGQSLENDDHQYIPVMRPRVPEFHIDSFCRFSLSTTSAIVDTIFRVCRPQTVTFPATYPPYYCNKLERRILKSVDGLSDVTITLREDAFQQFPVQKAYCEKKGRSSTWLGFKFFGSLFNFS